MSRQIAIKKQEVRKRVRTMEVAPSQVFKYPFA